MTVASAVARLRSMVRTERFWLCLLIGISLSTSVAASHWYRGEDPAARGLGATAAGVLLSLPSESSPAPLSPTGTAPANLAGQPRLPAWIDATLRSAPTPLAVTPEIASALTELDAVVAADRKKAAEAKARKAAARRDFDMNPGVTLAPRIEAKVAAIAKIYRAKTGKRLLVTSGTRSAFSQARAMHNKLRLGDNVLGLYRNKGAVREILAAYKRGSGSAVERMANVIRSQTERGVYISRHLRAGAVDLRSRGLTASDKRALREAVRQVGGVSNFLEESKPPHFHLEFN